MSKETITESGIHEETDSWSSLEIVLREGAMPVHSPKKN